MKDIMLILLLQVTSLGVLTASEECPCDGGTTAYSVDCDGDGTNDACSNDECDPELDGEQYIKKDDSVDLAISNGKSPYTCSVTAGSSYISASVSGSTVTVTGNNSGLGTVEVEDANGNTGTFDVTCYKINTTTWADSPDRSRVRLGLAEFVDLEIEPASLGGITTWSITSGSGELFHEPTEKTASTTLEAPVTSGSVAVTMSIDSGVETCAVTFTVVAPDSVFMVKDETLYVGQNYLGVLYTAFVYIGPSDVNFSRLSVIERGCNATNCSGEYSACEGHPEWSSFVGLQASGHSSSHGTLMSEVDNIGSIHDKTSGFVESSKKWPIPWDYEVSSSSTSGHGSIATVDQDFDISISGSPQEAKLVVSKAGTSEQCTITN